MRCTFATVHYLLLRDMKKMKSLLLVAVLCCAGWLTSCNGNADAGKVAVDSVAADTGDVVLAAVDRYLVDSIAVHYAEAELCIPSVTVVAKVQNSPDSVKVWGDFWVFNYNVVDDTLKMVSGGDHPGMMCLKKATDGTYQVASFDRVGDGSDFTPSAKRIFGSMYETFCTIQSRHQAREKVRAQGIAKYVKDNSLSVKYYQDFGWPAREIPTK